MARCGGSLGAVSQWALLLALGGSGCIEFFAEPPDLGLLTPAPVVEPDGDAPPDDLAVDSGPDGCEPGVEICDGVDNDCNGSADEGAGESLCPPLTSHAGSADRVCHGGGCVLVCHASQHDLDGLYATGCEYACTPFDPPATDAWEVCNGRDDDCDGRTDEATDLEAPIASEQRGSCAGARQICTDGGWREPLADELVGVEAVETLCDGVDNDCDGAVDDVLGCQCARLAGALICERGCDGWDEDNDGRSDEYCFAVTCGLERVGRPVVPPCNDCPDGTVVPGGWVCIPAGDFTMGSPAGEVGRDAEEGPQFPVRISRPFLMKATEVTQREWEAARVGPNRSRHQPCLDCPVETVTWYDALNYVNRLSLGAGTAPCYVVDGCDEGSCNVRFDANCTGYRLPTEAEWEYAARAGSGARFWWGEVEAVVPLAAWHRANSGDETHPVGQLIPSPWGLYDVYGNVWEMTTDWLQHYPNPPPAAAVLNPIGAINGERVRGGSHIDDATSMRSAERDSVAPAEHIWNKGFRPIRVLP